jgi:hypothetical protein
MGIVSQFWQVFVDSYYFVIAEDKLNCYDTF